MPRIVSLFLLISGLACAQDARLSQIKAILEPMRKHLRDHMETRGATPEFTTVKHLLRDWIESRLATLKATDDPTTIASELNKKLREAGLLPPALTYPATSTSQPQDLGYLEEIRIERPSWLTVITGVGIQVCGFDESAYVYEFPKDHWHRIFEAEQNDYRENKYFPQLIRGVHVSPGDYSPGGDRDEHLILTLGWFPWCTSNWQPVYYRVWRIKPSYSAPKLLIDESEQAYRAHEPEIKGSVGFNDVLIEYAVAGRDHHRAEIRHYHIDVNDKVTRVDPRALSPIDFVEEWGLRVWTTSSAWTQSSSRQRLAAAYRSLKSRLGERDYGPTTRCANRPDLWQVTLTPGFEETTGASMYFLVRWRPPYRFTMVDSSDKPWPACSQPDPQADEPRTLFPTQDWR